MLKTSDQDVPWQSWLGDFTQALELEIGYGSSRLLYTLARNAPDTKFIGVDKNPFWHEAAVRKMLRARNGISNLTYLNAEGLFFLESHVPSSRLQRLHIYFPSPHPRDERIFSSRFVDEVYRVLIYGGEMRVITDSRNYFNDIARLLNTEGWRYLRWKPLSVPLAEGLLVGTPCEFEYGSKYVLQSIKI